MTEAKDKRIARIFDKLVNSGVSELYAGFVMRFPYSLIAKNFLEDMPHGSFGTYLLNNEIVKAMQYADLENHRNLITLFSEENWRKNFSQIPAFLKKK